MTVEVETVHVLVGGQYGSEGKGAVAGAMVQRWDYDLLIRVAGPNAGHTTVDQDGTPRALRQIPAAGVQDHDALLYIAPGSEVDLQVLADDLAVYEAAEAPVWGRLFVSPQATVITPNHVQTEQSEAFGATGSTRKGIGAARAARGMRTAKLVADFNTHPLFDRYGVVVGEPPSAGLAMIEGTQGYWLGSHAGLYPYCTSSDCRAIDFLAMAGVRWRTAVPFVVFRSFPIRIAGNSGPLQSETTWDRLGLKPEYTTVTKKMRRVGLWEMNLVNQALVDNHLGKEHPRVALTFMDYLDTVLPNQVALARDMMDARPGELVYIGNGPGSGVWL